MQRHYVMVSRRNFALNHFFSLSSNREIISFPPRPHLPSLPYSHFHRISRWFFTRYSVLLCSPTPTTLTCLWTSLQRSSRVMDPFEFVPQAVARLKSPAFVVRVKLLTRRRPRRPKLLSKSKNDSEINEFLTFHTFRYREKLHKFEKSSKTNENLQINQERILSQLIFFKL